MWTFIYRFVACFCKNISANIYQENNSEWNNCLLKIEWNNCLLSLTYATQQTLKYISNFYPSVFYCSNSWIKFFLKLHFFNLSPEPFFIAPNPFWLLPMWLCGIMWLNGCSSVTSRNYWQQWLNNRCCEHLLGRQNGCCLHFSNGLLNRR